jgi:hypothetical protein
MKKIILITLSLFTLITFNACKKGCTDPYAKNYNAKKTKDNGKCEVYNRVILHSIDVKTIPEKTSNGYLWDDGHTGDKDNNNSFPELYTYFKAEGGYDYDPQNYYETIDPYNVNISFELNPTISVTDWKNDKGFWVYFYDVDSLGYYLELIDSVKIKPFDLNADDEDIKFKDTIDVSKNGILFTANMSWE